VTILQKICVGFISVATEKFSMRNLAIPPSFLLPGTIVNAPMKGWFGLTRHFGIVSAKRGVDGMPIMIANAQDAGGPAEEVWAKFTEGNLHERAYYPSKLPPDQVLYNAYGMFGTRYNLLAWNCEHFVNACHGLRPHSRQVAGGLALAAVVGGIALAASRR
jgi:hypothetical protein